MKEQKQKMEKPEIELIEFQSEDVITTSGDLIPLPGKDPEPVTDPDAPANQDYWTDLVWDNELQ